MSQVYFYYVSDSSYDTYSESIVYHTNKFTSEEFSSMYNEALDNLKERPTHEDIAKYLVEHHGFGLVNPEVTIHAGFGRYRKVTPEDIENIKDNQIDL